MAHPDSVSYREFLPRMGVHEGKERKQEAGSKAPPTAMAMGITHLRVQRTEGSRPLYGQLQGSLAERLGRCELRIAQCSYRVSIMSPRWGIKCPSFGKIWFFKRVWRASNVLSNFKEGAV